MSAHRTVSPALLPLASRLLHGALMALTLCTPALAFYLGQEELSRLSQLATESPTNATALLPEGRHLLVGGGCYGCGSCGLTSCRWGGGRGPVGGCRGGRAGDCWWRVPGAQAGSRRELGNRFMRSPLAGARRVGGVDGWSMGDL